MAFSAAGGGLARLDVQGGMAGLPVVNVMLALQGHQGKAGGSVQYGRWWSLQVTTCFGNWL